MKGGISREDGGRLLPGASSPVRLSSHFKIKLTCKEKEEGKVKTEGKQREVNGTSKECVNGGVWGGGRKRGSSRECNRN